MLDIQFWYVDGVWFPIGDVVLRPNSSQFSISGAGSQGGSAKRYLRLILARIMYDAESLDNLVSRRNAKRASHGT